MVPAPRRILAATDLTASGDATLGWACALAAKGCAVTFVHVVDEELYPSPLYAHYTPGVVPTPEQREAQLAELHARLQASVPAGAASRGVPVTVEILEGDDVAEAITACADRVDADLVVLGTRRRNPLAKALLGSVENSVLARCRRPILLVPGEKA